MEKRLYFVFLLASLSNIYLCAGKFPSSDLTWIVPYSQEEMMNIDINKRNYLLFIVSSSSTVTFQGQTIEVSDIRERVKYYIRNSKNDRDLPKVLEWPRMGGLCSTQNTF